MPSKGFTNGFSGRDAIFMTVILREIPIALKTWKCLCLHSKTYCGKEPSAHTYVGIFYEQT